ncbi:Putative F-box/LRR-repeat protein At5g02930 [Linum perenne]
MLPDEIISKILSCLSLKEAVRSSVLSSKWRHLWKYANLELDFDSDSERVINRILYANWVNGILRQLQHNSHSKLRKFRIVFTNSSRYSILPEKEDIYRWLEFAISKRIESLQLIFSNCGYDFSDDFYNHIKTPAGISDIKSLKCLRLSGMELRDGFLEHLIANCPLLEELSITYSSGLTSLRVVGSSSSSLPLKYLEIGYCSSIKSLEIKNAPFLSRLVHASTDQSPLQVENCSSLVDLTLFTWNPCSTFKSLSSYFAQLKSFYWETDSGYLSYLLEIGLVEYNRLERLAIKINGPRRSIINWLIPFINACPRLHTLQLFMDTYFDDENEDNILNNDQVDVVKMDHKDIKVVEIIGFDGCPMEHELIDYFMKYFTGLKKLVLDPGSTILCPSYNSIYCSRVPTYPNDILGYEAALEFKSKVSKTFQVIVIPFKRKKLFFP